jgi:hypothetical protein
MDRHFVEVLAEKLSQIRSPNPRANSYSEYFQIEQEARYRPEVGV